MPTMGNREGQIESWTAHVPEGEGTISRRRKKQDRPYVRFHKCRLRPIMAPLKQTAPKEPQHLEKVAERPVAQRSICSTRRKSRPGGRAQDNDLIGADSPLSKGIDKRRTRKRKCRESAEKGEGYQSKEETTRSRENKRGRDVKSMIWRGRRETGASSGVNLSME